MMKKHLKELLPEMPVNVLAFFAFCAVVSGFIYQEKGMNKKNGKKATFTPNGSKCKLYLPNSIF